MIEYQGAPLVRRAAASAAGAGAQPIVVVVGAEAKKVRAALAAEDVIVCENLNWDSGLASSLRVGITAVQSLKDVDGALVLLVDQPHVSSDVLRELISAFSAGHRLVGASYEGVVGVPAVFGREYFEELMHFSGDKGAGHWLRAQGTKVQLVPVSSAALDIDTQADVEKLLGSSD